MLTEVLLVQGWSIQTLMSAFRCLLTLCVTFLLAYMPLADAAGLSTSSQQIYFAEDQQVLPHRYSDVPHWLNKLSKVDRVDLTGGSYWLVKKLSISEPSQWIASVDGPIIENIDYYLYSEGNQIRHLSSGYSHPYEYLFSYARHIDTPTLGGYWLITRISSQYYSEQPQLSFGQKAKMTHIYHWRASIITLCLGGLFILALYNGAVSLVQQDRIFGYFSAYLFAVTLSLALVFHVGAHLFHFTVLSVQMLPVLGIPIFSVLFYCRFLNLPNYAPRLWQASRLLVVVSLVAIPAAAIWVNYAVVLIYSVVLIWVALAFSCGIQCWRQGAKQALLFILSTLMLLIPAILLAMSTVPKNSSTLLAADVSVLLSCLLSTLFMSLTLHYKFRRLTLESLLVNEQLNLERDAARLDALTGLQNRYAFNEYVNNIEFETEPFTCLSLIDIDYLKSVNDQAGHQEGDKLIKLVAEALNLVLSDKVQLFRIGGDEFAVFTSKLSSDELRDKLAIADKVIQLNGSAQSGISFGCSTTDECDDAEQLFYRADMAMYQQKAQRKRKIKLIAVSEQPQPHQG
ncbi:sensor domain-containing diguanylate cyclase [Agarivorans sp. TSD2052]|uniref:GGDEF domain-containing protein n=1 Tax=Agarivorans sp. TSD2052 TaxID=2937286 RepID=UPI00200D3851|nr:GGDEF domain-containing protein [Agarivorans sp. TSD2052]UPW18538.1 sensor domain-containing diguanylate cyclase [Agarivorans sp. TSD2052]